MIRTALLAAAALLLAACAATTPTYSPAANATSAGYSENQIESNRYFVTYRGAGPTDPAILQDYAMLRAADIALQNGRDWFWVDRRNLDDESVAHSGPSIGIGVGGGSFGRHGGAGASVGMNFPLGHSSARARSATLEIRLGEGAKPDDPNAYDARSTSSTIRARMAAAQ